MSFWIEPHPCDGIPSRVARFDPKHETVRNPPERKRERADCAEGEQHTNPQRHRPQTRADKNHGQKPGSSSQAGVTAPSADAHCFCLLLSPSNASSLALNSIESFSLNKNNVGVDQK